LDCGVGGGKGVVKGPLKLTLWKFNFEKKNKNENSRSQKKAGGKEKKSGRKAAGTKLRESPTVGVLRKAILEAVKVEHGKLCAKEPQRYEGGEPRVKGEPNCRGKIWTR